MAAKAGKQKRVKRPPAIVPRFLKSAVTIGAIPALVAACDRPKHTQPVVAYYAAPLPPADAPVSPPVRIDPPVVAAYQGPVEPAVPAEPPRDAGVDAAPARPTPKPQKQPRPIPPVVFAYQAPSEPTTATPSKKR